MAMGQRPEQAQGDFWIATERLAPAPAHPFYQKLNQVLAAGGFDRFCQTACQKFYAQKMGRPSIPPGVYFRMLLLGYFEKLDSEREIAWRCADSLALRAFLGYRVDAGTPQRGRQRWTARDPQEQEFKRQAQQAVYRNRRRRRGAHSKRLHRRRGEYVERTFAHVLNDGGMRRVWLKGREKIAKRYLIHTAAFNLGLLMRKLTGYGTPRGWVDAARAAALACADWLRLIARRSARWNRLAARFAGQTARSPKAALAA